MTTRQATLNIEDAPTEHLVQIFLHLDSGEAQVVDANPEGWKGIIAFTLNERGALGGCGCAGCTRLRDYAIAWKKKMEER